MITAAQARKSDFFAIVEALESSLSCDVVNDAPRDEQIIFRHAPDLQFSASDVSDLNHERDHVSLTTTFLGTTGPHGILPDAMLEEAVLHDGIQSAHRAWSEVFHHRAIALFYRLIRRTRGPEMWFPRVEAMTRSANRGLQSRHLHAIAPLLATRRRSARGLQRALEILIGIECPNASTEPRVALEELAGARIALIPSERTFLGRQRHQLGRGVILGGNIADPSGEVHVSLEVSDSTADRWLEGGDLHALVLATCRLFDTSSTRFRVTTQLRRTEGSRLGRGIRLGRSAELRARPAPQIVRAPALT